MTCICVRGYAGYAGYSGYKHRPRHPLMALALGVATTGYAGYSGYKKAPTTYAKKVRPHLPAPPSSRYTRAQAERPGVS